MGDESFENLTKRTPLALSVMWARVAESHDASSRKRDPTDSAQDHRDVRRRPVHSQYTKSPLTALSHRYRSTTKREQYQRFRRVSTITDDPDNDLGVNRSWIRRALSPRGAEISPFLFGQLALT